MNTISIEQFIELVQKRANIIVFGPRGQWVFQNLYNIKTVEDKAQLDFDRVQILQFKNPINIPDDEITVCSSYDELIRFLHHEGYIKNGLLHANQSYDQLIEEIMFEHMTMKDLLIKYRECETFSLTCPYNEGQDELHPYGKYSITKEQSDVALLQIVADQIQLYPYYKTLPKTFRSQYTFENLLEAVEQDALTWYESVKNHELEADESPYAGDWFMVGKARFKSPKALWHFYHAQDTANQYRIAIAHMRLNTESRLITFTLEEPEYLDLKPSYLFSVVSFSWHCTTSNVLSITHHFKLDETSKAWLSSHDDDYDMNRLEDLAFYYKGQLAFSSCTHEHVHCDYLEAAKKSAREEA